MSSRPAPASLLVLVLVFLLAGAIGQARLATDPPAVDAGALTFATIVSDATEYLPGQTVMLTGGGWTPGETVTIVLHRQPLLHPDTVLTAVADGSGTITLSSFAPALDEDGVTFFVTATGSVSGLQATTTFVARARKISWVGVVSTDWNTAANWDSGIVPDNGDDLTIPANVASARYPVVNSTAFAKSITLTAGAGLAPTLTMTGGTLSVSGVLELNGGARVIQSGGVIDVIDFDSEAASSSTFTQSGGTFRLHHNFTNLGVFDSTGGTIEFAGAGAGANAFNAPGTNQFNNVVVNSGVNTDFSSKADAQILVAGNWTMNGTADLITRNTRVTFNGNGAQTIGGAQQTTFRNLFVDKTAGTSVTLARPALVTNGDVIVVSGTLDLATFTLNRSALGGEIGVVTGAFLKIGGTNSFPLNYAIHSFNPTSTVDYYGTSQTVTAETYGHLNLSTSGTKTMPATAMTIQGNFTMSGTASATAAANLTVNGNFTLGPGTTFGAASSSHIVRANFSNSGTFTAGTSTFTFNGTGTQTIGGSNSTTFSSLNIDNVGGVVLSGVNTTVNGTLTFTSGNVTTGPRFIATSATGNVSRTSGHVVGNLQKFVATGATTLTYEIGDSGAYTPVTVIFGSVSGAGTLTGSTTPGDHPNTGTSPVDRLKSVNRYWTFTNSGLSFTNYSATFNFVPGDLDPGANTNAFIVGKFSGAAWTAPTVGTRTPSSTEIIGVTSFSDFQIGESAHITTLGSGADPANTTVAPGSAATTAGAFTFQTDGLTDTVTAVTVTLAPGTFASLLQLQITDDAESIVYGSVNPLSDTPSIQLTTPITVTTTSTQYKIRVRPESHALMPAPPGSSYALTARVSSWTGSNANHAGSDSGGTTVTIDNLSPGSVTGATATSGTTQVTLAWTNPADSDLGTIIVLRRAGSAVSDTPTEGATYSVGNIIGSSTVACVVTAPATGCADSGLTNGTVYHYKIFANDSSGNYAIGVVPTGSPVTPNVTTLGNGTEPPNATIAPSGVATMADAFTFQTGSGTDAITAVTVTMAPGTSAGVSLLEITNDAGSIVYGSVSDPSSDTPSIPLTTPITATTTVTQYKIRVTPKLHVAMPVPPGASYALTASVSSWTGTNAQAGSNGGGTTITIDNLSPGDVTSATAITGDQQLTLAWTNPADADLGTILVLRRAGSPVAVTPTEGVKYFVGDTVGSSIVACVVTAPATSCTDHEVDNGTVYHYKVFAQDTNRNYASGIVPTGSPITPTVTTIGDGTPVSSATIAPGGAATMADAFTFQTASGTDAITAITVTLASGTSAAVSVVEITDVAGTIVYGSVSNPSSETFTIALSTNIIATTTSTQYRIRVTPKSHAAMPAPPGTTYALTAHIDDWTGTHAKGGSDSGNTVITIDNRSPGNVSNATATAASTQVLLGWTNPADSDLGTIVVLRRAGAVVGDTPAEGVTYSVGNTVGSSTVACVTSALGCADVGLNNGTDYHYKIFAKDVDGNYATGVVPNGSPALPFSRITVTPTSGLTTTEAGGTATFTVVLISRPIADVTIGLSSSDTTQGTVNKSSLTFTSANWDIPQTVTVTGVDDAVADGDKAYSIITAPAVSVGGYSGQDASDVTVTSIDNDTAGITVNPTAGLFTTEGGGTATFGVVLNSKPTANVTIGVSSNNTTEGTVSPASLTFTAANWNLPQTVTVTGVNDAVADGNIVYTILTALATSTDTVYNGIDAADVSVTNIDSNTVGIIVNPTAGLITTEALGTATFAVVLNSQPTADVTIGLSSSDTTEGTISVSSVIFTTANWNVPQIVTVIGVNDNLDDGDIGYTIVTAAATSSDSNYNGLNAGDVAVTNTDNDTAGITVTPTSGLTTTEAGGTATFTIVLNSQPTADVTIGVSSSNTLEGAVSPASLTFTSANWDTPQTVTVTGANDFVDDGDSGYLIITAPAASSDGNYNALNASDVSVTNTDDETAGITVTPTSGLTTTEAGGTATFTVVLNSQPTADVTIGLISNDPTEATVSAASVTFTSANWNTPQTITVTGVSDAIADGNVAYSILTSAAASGDPNYDRLDVSNVSATNTDDDTAGIVVTPTSGLITSEIGGETPTFTVVLTSQPTADVVIALTSSDTTEGVVGPDRLTFTSANWNVPQTVTLFGANDVVDDGDIPYTIVTAPATSGDPAYSGMNASDVSATNIDSDVAGFFVNPISGLTTTEAGGTAHFTVVLNSQPSADVIIALSSSNPSEGTVSPASLTFTSDNWNIPQTVDVTGVNDTFDDGDVGYTIVTAAAVSADPGYNGLNPLDVSVLNVDNDAAGITVSPTFGLTTTESGGTATFTIVLNSQPTADVTIALSSSNPSEGTVSLASVTFTTANWNTARTVTVTGANDLFDDGDVIYSIVTAAATSGDLAYNGLNAGDVSVTNTDDDTAGFTLTPTSGLITTEAGGAASFTVVLTARPTANVTLGLISSDTSEGTVNQASVTFTSDNWNTPQTVTITGVNDFQDDGDIAYDIVTTPASSSDSSYNGLSTGNVSVTNTDNDAAGIAVTPSFDLTTTEGGGTATFTVVLTSQPTADVTIGLTSSDTTEGTISVSSLTFTAANWNTPRTVTVTGVNDVVDDGDISYAIVTAAATSSDPDYNLFDASNVLVTNADNDVTSISVTPSSGLTTTEAGGTATYTIVLTSQPSADVTIALSSTDTTEGTISQSSLTFTPANWSVPQTVTVTGVNDAVDDGDILYSISNAPATSADASYNGLDPIDVAVTNADGDTAGIIVTPITGRITTEAGGTTTFAVVLRSQPTADVTIGLSSNDLTEGTVGPSTLTFTTVNWNVAQTVTVTGVNDDLDDGDKIYRIVTAAAVSADLNYGGFDPIDVFVTNTDDDVAGITVTPISGLTTTEAGGTATFTVVLNAQPTADVVIGLNSSNTAEGTVVPSLTFTSANWNTPQTVTVTGVNDALDDGDIAYSIVTAAATSSDLNYAGIDASDVSVTNADNDAAGITVTPTSGLTTTEAGGTATFTVVLTSQPTADVTIGLSSSDATEGTVSSPSLTFTSANWNTPQTVTVTGVNDFLDDGDIAYSIVTAAATSADAAYAGLSAADVAVSNTDNDAAGITVSPTTPLATTEAGGTATFTVVLNTQPTQDVTIALSSSDTTEGTVSAASLVFTSVNWATPQTVTVTGADDLVVDGPITYTIVTAPAVSTDANYNTRDAADVLVTNSDNDVAGITVTATPTPLATTEAGGTASFTVVLNTQPTANVTIALTSSTPAEGTVSPASLVFTSANWNVAQTVTVTGADDLVVDGPITYTIVTAPAVSTDPNYNTRDANDVLVTNADNDTAGITVTAATTPLATTEAGGTATFTVKLNTQPTANVTIALSSSNPAEGTVLPASLVFTSANWNVAQTVTVTGADDAVVDGPITYTIVTAPAASTDPNYNTRDAADVLVTNSDNDTAGITVTAATTPLATTEAGGTATFTVVLNTQPTANVTMALTSSNPAEGGVSPASLVFTSANWNVAQTVTVTGADDAVVDGPITYTIVTAPAVSTDANYNTRDAADVLVTNSDNDAAGITVTAATTPLATSEAGGTATFTVALNTQPTANVTIALSSSNPAEGTVLPASLVFTSANWNVAQTVTVTGVDDTVVDGPITYTIVTAPAVSTDANYNTRDAADVLVTNSDNDSAGITVTAATTPLTTSETGGTATFTVVLNTQPTANVTMALSSSNPLEGTVNPASLTFTPADWNVPQTVTVTGADDTVVDGPITYTIVTAPAVSADTNYNTRDAADVLVTNSDNDVAGITVTATPTPLATTEAGGTATFTVVLNTQPTANVTIALSSSNPAEGTVLPTSLVFTSANWNVAQTVTVTGTDDAVADGPITYTIATAPAVSTDANYNTRDAADVLVTNSDNDNAGITVTAATTPLTTTEAGGTATFTVVLNTQPMANVTIALSSSNPAEGTVFPASLVFTSANWNVAQTVTVTGADDLVVDGPITFTIATAPAVSTDANYNTRDAADVLVTNSDNDAAGITVTATPTPLATTEAGGTATFTVVLNSMPTANVTIALSSSKPAEGTVNPASLVFTSANWNVAQTVTVTGVDDQVVDGPQPYTIVTAPAVSTDANYNTRDAADVLVTNADNDVAGITVTATPTPLATTEAGGTATFTVVLNSQPTANVTMALTSSNPAEGTVLPASLVFTSANWNVAQTVTVTGVDDTVVDGPITYTIATAPAVSTDPNYNTRDAADVLVTNADNDVAGITVTAATTPLTTSESGGTATFTVVLNTQPTANVTIALTSSNPAEGGVSPASLVFTSANWNVAQTVTVTGADDAIVDGPITYTIVTAPAVSTDANYNTRDAADVLVTNSDNDTAGITVTAATTPLTTTEAGGTATFTVVLNTQPTANVTIALTSSNPAEGTVLPASLVFTTANWNVAQTVTVTGADDLAVDGPITYTIVTAPAVSTDANYNTRDAADVLVTNSDNDAAGITVTAATTPLTTSEAGGTATFTVVLNTMPTANVTIALTSSTPAEGTVSPASLVFTSANWNVAQTVTVTGADDAVVDGPITYTIATAPAVSTDANYNTRDAADVLVTNNDNDSAGITVSPPTTPLTTSEAGGTATFTVVLNTQPTANVTIALSSSNPAEGTVLPASLVFTSANWNVAQTVTVTGADDLVVDGPITYTIVTAPAVSTDTNYNTRDAADVLVTNADNDVAGITVTATPTPLATTEAGGTATFTVVLNTQPTANVTIALSSSNPAEGTVLPTSLVFTSANWNVAQTVTVTGADDAVVDGPITYTIATAPAVSTDANYNTRDAADVLVTNSDNDTAGITVTAATTPLTTTEAGGTATFTVVLNTQPTANVTMALTSSNPAEGGVSPASLVFTSANWNVAQTVTVTGADDLAVDGPITYTIVTAPAVSTDPSYNTRDAADVLVTNSDNDVAGITVTATPTPLATTEAGGTATFTVVLNTQPTANVTIALTSSNPAEGGVSPASLVFTSANWNVPQTVTVTGADDTVVDGPITYTIVTAPAVSTDLSYNTRNAADVLVTNSDNDVAGITVTAATTPLTTTEAGGTATFTVVLNTQPTANVAMALSSSNPAEGTVLPTILVFTSANWNVAQTVTVTGADDLVADGPITYTIVTAPSVSTDANYNTRNAADVLVTNTDNDVAGITVTATPTPLATTEAGGTATFTVVLNSQPTANVTIALTSSTPAEGTVSPASLVFTSANWNVAQTVTVTGADDLVVDGPITYTIVTAPAVSTDANYNTRDANDVLVTNADNDTAGITVTAATTPLTTTEAGGTATFTVVLNTQPTANVTIPLTSSNPAEGGVSPASLVFTSANWNVAQTVTVTGADDTVVDGPITYTIVTAPAVSTDANYNTRDAADVLVTNSDNDTAGITVTAATTPLTTSEAGGTATFTVVLNTQPTANVTIALTSSNPAEGTALPASLVFTSANWATPQTVTVTGADDTVVDGPITYTIVTAPAVSTDANYNTRDAADVLVTNSDNDAAGITVTAATTPLATTEAGGTATFTVVLNTQPTANVTMALTSSNPAEGTVLPASLVFTTANWNVAQTVTVTGADDTVVDGPITYTIVTAPAVSTDANYGGRDAADVLVTNSDNDVPGITVTAATTPLATTEAGGTATFTVVLNTQPTANVTMALTSSNPAEGGVSPASLVFTSANWSVAQTVTVTGADDAVVDGPITYTIVTAPAVSTDANYNTRDASDVLVTNSDNDAAGITVTAATTPLATTEAGGTATFTVVLNTMPTANVTIALTSSNPAEGTVLPASLVFTSANWATPQTVTVTGADDLVVDGPITYTIVTAPAVSTDANYNTRDANDVLVTNADNDTAGITISPTTPLTTTEAGGTATFTVVLNTQPTADVTIGLSSSDTTEGTVSPASLIFTSANWNVPQTVTVTGVSDTIDDGDVAYSIVTAAATSSDTTYNGLNANDVAVTNTHQDVSADLSVAITNGDGVNEVTAGGLTTYTVVVANAGPGGVVSANVAVAAPAQVTFNTWTCVASVGSTCPASGTGNIAASVNLVAGGTATFTIPATISSAASGTVTNTATVSVPPGTIDPIPANNSAVDTDAVLPAAAPTADLSVTKTNGVTLVSAGTTTTYAVVVSNVGPDAANSALFTDPVATGLTKTSVTCAAAGGAICPASPTVAQVEAGLAIPGLPFGGSVTFMIGATVTAASGNVTNIATVTAPAGVVDLTPANNSASDTDNAGTTVDLSLTVTNGTNSVAAAGTTTYTIVVANAGTTAADGAVLTLASAGLQPSSLTCAASGGAVCPSGPTVARMDVGLSLPTLPGGGVLTFTVDVTVTAASGTVSVTATLTLPAGVSDPNIANNSATDTDSIIAAPIVADLVVTKSDGATELLPGSTTTYTITVTNKGPDAVTGARLTDAAPAGLTFGNWTCVATAGSSCESGGVGSLSTAVNLQAGGTATFSVPATVAANAPASIANTATATVPSGVTDPVPANNQATDVNEAVPPQSLAVEVRVGQPTVVGPTAFEVPYSIDVRNTGPNPLTNLQASDSLSSAFAQGAPTLTISAPMTASGPCVANSGFTGIGSESDASTQLLSGSGSVGVGQICNFAFRVRVAYRDAAAIPATEQTNRVRARTSTRAGGVTVASGEGAASVQLRLPRIDVTKMVRGVTQLGDEPVFDISYAIVLRNTSEAAAPYAQATDNLAETFAAGAPVISIVAGPTIESGNASLTLASSFNGTTATAMLTGSDTMMPGTESRIAFTVRVRYETAASIPVGIDLNNSAIATTSVTSDGVIIARDESTDVTESGAPPRADDEPQPTPVRLVPRARLTVEKIANTLVGEIGDAVQYAVRVRNVGGPSLPDVSVTDRLPLGFRYIAGSARLGVSGAAQPLPDPVGGPGPVLTFAIPAQPETDEVTITYRVRIGVGALQGDGINRADAASGDVRSNTARARVIVTGGVFTTDGCVVGTIFADRNGNGVQDPDEPGVPDVHVSFEEGTTLVSDGEGKYSYCGLRPTTHVLHVDRTTLPAGGELTMSSNRNAGNAGSLFVDLKPGEVHRADFIVDASTNPKVLEEIGVRRERAATWVPSFDEPARSAAIGARPATGTGAIVRGGVAGATMQSTRSQAIGGFEQIRQAGGLNPANSNAPEPLPADARQGAVVTEHTQGVMPLSTTLRPMLAVGLLDGVVSVTRASGGLFSQAQSDAAFDREFRRFSYSFNGGQGEVGGRGALFVKGTVAEHYLLTLAYDSDKDERGVLFRDIQPDAFYPVYGDSSLKQFDAQTSGRFYARVDRGLGYVMFGDLQSSSFSPAVQQLGAYNRALTGVQHHFENTRTMFNVFASHDSLRQVIDEFAALGISGPYPVSNSTGVSGTERVEIITRDRNQPALVLSTVQLTRFTDYEFEPFSGRLLFRRPVPALDERLNPQSIRVTYEVDAGAEKSWVGGANVQVRLGGALQMGGSWIKDSSPGSPFSLRSVNTTLRLSKSSTIVIEGAQSIGTISTGVGGPPSPTTDADPEGSAARIEWRLESKRLVARAFGAITDPGFNNPASTLTPGRTEAGGRARLTITDGVHFNAEVIHSEDRLTDGRRDGGLVSIETKWRPLVFELGLRRATGTAALGLGANSSLFGSNNTNIDPATGQPAVQPGFTPQLSAGATAPAADAPLDVMTLRGKVTYLFSKRANVYGEGEQDVRVSSRRVAAVGAQLLITDRVKLYGRHEFITSLDGPYALTEGQRSYNTVFGVASSYMKDGDVFSEYRLGDAISGREAEAAIGLRNQWTLSKGVRLHTGFERLHAIAGVEREATAASVGLEYLASERFKSTARLEWRKDSSSDSWLSTAGFAQKLSRSWTMLAKNYFQLTAPDGASNQTQDRFSIGAAYRDTAKNRVNLLTRYELRVEDTPDLSLGAAADRRVQVVSTHVDVHPLRAWTFSGQHAAKFVNDRTETSPARFGINLVSGRVGFDLTERWDIGGLTSVMWDGEGGHRSALGGEVGFRLQNNLWLAAGYNATGFTDRDLVSSNFTTRGMFLRLRVKFDESAVPKSPDGR